MKNEERTQGKNMRKDHKFSFKNNKTKKKIILILKKEEEISSSEW